MTPMSSSAVLPPTASTFSPPRSLQTPLPSKRFRSLQFLLLRLFARQLDLLVSIICCFFYPLPNDVLSDSFRSFCRHLRHSDAFPRRSNAGEGISSHRFGSEYLSADVHVAGG